MWLMMHCAEIDGNYYFRLGVEGGDLHLSPIDIDDIEAVTIRKAAAAKAVAAEEKA